jgi:hypothetical protein
MVTASPIEGFLLVAEAATVLLLKAILDTAAMVDWRVASFVNIL